MTKYDLSQNRHRVLSDLALQIGSIHKCNYHETVINRQRSLGRVLSKTERNKAWNDSLPGYHPGRS